MTTSIKEMSNYTQLSVSSRPFQLRRLAILLVASAYLLLPARSMAVTAMGMFWNYAAKKGMQYALEQYPDAKTWVSNKLAQPCNRCNPKRLEPGEELQKHLEEHPECKDCEQCGGDGLIHVTDRLVGGSYEAPRAETVSNYANGCEDAKQKLADNLKKTALGGLLAGGKYLYNKLADACEYCNKTGTKLDEMFPKQLAKVKACQYCNGDGLSNMHDRMSCPNCVCTDSDKPRKDCREWHWSTAGRCPTKSCSACAAVRGEGKANTQQPRQQPNRRVNPQSNRPSPTGERFSSPTVRSHTGERSRSPTVKRPSRPTGQRSRRPTSERSRSPTSQRSRSRTPHPTRRTRLMERLVRLQNSSEAI